MSTLTHRLLFKKFHDADKIRL